MSAPLPQAERPASTARAPGLPWAKILLGLVALVGLLYLGRSAGAHVPRFAQWVDGLGALGPVVFVLGYATAVVAFVPGSLLTLAAGAIFGLAEGTLYVFLAATTGATGAFLLARHGARAAIERRIEGDPRFAAIDRAIGREGRKIAFLLRLSPVFPFNLLNYALGLTKVRLGDYVVACLGMLPGTLLYVYTGKLVGDVAAVAGGAGPERGAGYWTLLVVGLLATAAVTLFVTRLARRALADETGASVPGESA
ncbi:MAG TPA: TVP38/TMEM64 family protein [Myxococcota bacterium]|nr:TVP38/TMEM64 family protein [Myxococcota bacterium]